MSGPIDVYAAFVMQADPVHINILNPDGQSFQTFPINEVLLAFAAGTLPAGVLPWQASTAGPINELLFSRLPLSGLPSGTYTVYTLVTSAGTLTSYYLWSTGFTISSLPPIVYDCTPATAWQELSVDGDPATTASPSGFYGNLDPCVRRDPNGNNQLYFMYSFPMIVPGGSTPTIEIHLAYSTDHGATWNSLANLWPYVKQPDGNYSSHEVSNLAAQNLDAMDQASGQQYGSRTAEVATLGNDDTGEPPAMVRNSQGHLIITGQFTASDLNVPPNQGPGASTYEAMEPGLGVLIARRHMLPNVHGFTFNTGQHP